MLPLKSVSFFQWRDERALCLRRQMTDARFQISRRRHRREPTSRRQQTQTPQIWEQKLLLHLLPGTGGNGRWGPCGRSGVRN